MKCQHVNRYLYDFCDNRLSPEIHNEIESHLRECEQCRLKVEFTQLENEVLSDKSTIPALSDKFTDSVMEKLSIKLASGTVGNPKKFAALFNTGNLVWAVALTAIVLLMIVVIPQVLPSNETQFQVADQSKITGHENVRDGSPINEVQTKESGKTDQEDSVYLYVGNSKTPLNKLEGKAPEEKPQKAMVLYDSEPITNNQFTETHTESVIPSRRSLSAAPVITNTPANAEFPYPVNIPTAYNFTNADKIDNRTVQYSFVDTEQKELSIIVTNIQSENADFNYLKTAAISENLSENKVNENPKSNPDEIFFDINGVSYVATLSGNISSHEANDLMKRLKFVLDASVTP